MSEIVFIVLAIVVVALVIKIGMKVLKYGAIAIVLYLAWWFLTHR